METSNENTQRPVCAYCNIAFALAEERVEIHTGQVLHPDCVRKRSGERVRALLLRLHVGTPDALVTPRRPRRC